MLIYLDQQNIILAFHLQSLILFFSCKITTFDLQIKLLFNINGMISFFYVPTYIFYFGSLENCAKSSNSQELFLVLCSKVTPVYLEGPVVPIIELGSAAHKASVLSPNLLFHPSHPFFFKLIINYLGLYLKNIDQFDFKKR